ncbi:N-acyl homoserine lactonase AiiB [Roseivivax jejudonensis]|uniref:N-acyl homoserine lactonase AiiB n=1 Tax=Roseivivax jejudonensis TaxID=1529041 RepID=A0A1X7A5I5_9RHOB|nr:MBL fold metallo-hydrolase [Roseivivax jejudonensis]SLN71167.1 N-acyl homoserine lactonase AiiB [Roseivivax jejudonensis]
MAIGQIPRMSPKTIGDLDVFSLLDTAGPTRPPGDMLKDVPEDWMSRHGGWLAPDYVDPSTGTMRMAYQSFLIRGPATILVDCAVGEDGEFPARPDWNHAKSDWLNHLGQAGCAPEDVDIVFLTHLHPDHTGWLTRKTPEGWTPTFPKARHVTSDTELEFWLSRHEEFAFMGRSVDDSIKPVHAAGLFDTISPGRSLAPGLGVVDLAGHSPGMIGLEHTKHDRTVAAFNADLMHHPLQMAEPECATIFCHDPEAAVATRKSALARYARDETLMFCNHFPGECAGYAVAEDEGYRFVPEAGAARGGHAQDVA